MRQASFPLMSIILVVIIFAISSGCGSSKAKDEIPQLISNLSDNDPQIRAKAALNLGNIVINAKSTIWDIEMCELMFLNNPDSELFQKRMELLTPDERMAEMKRFTELWEIDPVPDSEKRNLMKEKANNSIKETEVAISALLGCLYDEERIVHINAIRALGHISKDSEMVDSVVEALIGIFSDAPADRAKDADWKIHDEAIYALAKIGVPAVPYLLEAIKDEREGLRYNAVLVLSSFISVLDEANKNAVVPALIELLADQNVWIRSVTVGALGRAGRNPRVADAIIKTMGYEEDEFILNGFIDAARKTGAQPEQLLPLLTGFLDSKNDLLRFTTIQALGDIGPTAIEVLPKLKWVSEHDSAYIDDEFYNREAALSAIAKIEGKIESN